MSDATIKAKSILNGDGYNHKSVTKNLSDLLDQIEQKDILIQNLRGELAGNTCLMCNYLERADCYDQKTKLQARNKLLEKVAEFAGFINRAHLTYTKENKLNKALKALELK